MLQNIPPSPNKTWRNNKKGMIIQASLYSGGPASPWETLRKQFHESTLSSPWLGLRGRRRERAARAPGTVWTLVPAVSKRTFSKIGVSFHNLQ